MFDPYSIALPTASFDLASDEFAAGQPLPTSAWAPERGAGRSPSLRWQGAPAGTASLVVTGYDPDAPIPGGLWHWLLIDVPGDATELPAGAGSGDGPNGRHVPNSLGVAAYSGVQPPPGTGTHRLFLCVTALSVPTLEVPMGADAAMVHLCMIPHTLGRAVLVGTSHADAVAA